MPIIGLTDQGARLPLLGKIRKGAEKTEPKKPGADLATFRITSDDPDVTEAWKEVYAAHGGLFPSKIGVMLPHHTIEDNLESWREEWDSSSLIRRCDGRTQHIHLVGDKYSRQPIPCLGCDETGKKGCNYVARLRVIVPALARLGFFELETHSKWDIKHLAENLAAIEAITGTLQGIPLVLSRVEREISTPGFKDGESRRRTKKSLISLSIHKKAAAGIMQAIESTAHQRLATFSSAHPVPAIPAADRQALPEWESVN